MQSPWQPALGITFLFLLDLEMEVGGQASADPGMRALNPWLAGPVNHHPHGRRPPRAVAHSHGHTPAPISIHKGPTSETTKPHIPLPDHSLPGLWVAPSYLFFHLISTLTLLSEPPL